ATTWQAIVPPFLAATDYTQTNNGAGAANFAVNLVLFTSNGLMSTLSENNFPRMPASFPAGPSNTLLFDTLFIISATGRPYWGGGPPTANSTTPLTGNPVSFTGGSATGTGTTYPAVPALFGPTFGYHTATVTPFTGVPGTGGPYAFQPAPTQANCNPTQGSP